MSTFIFLHCTIFIFLTSSVLGVNEGILDKIKIGLKNAKNYFKTARDIADLVSESLRSRHTQKKRKDDSNFAKKQENNAFELTNLVSTFLRLVGLDSKKATAVTVNSFIFFAQIISELFKLTPKLENFIATNQCNQFSPIQIIKENGNKKIQFLLKQAQDKELPNQLIDQIDGNDSLCIKLLVCKVSPIIWAAQKSLSNGSVNGHHDITSWLPSKDKFEEYSDTCDDKHIDCPLNSPLKSLNYN